MQQSRSLAFQMAQLVGTNFAQLRQTCCSWAHNNPLTAEES
jgi:hypothetical protein